MGRVPVHEGAALPLSDIFAAQPSDPELLAEIYDLEHEEERGDHVFYAELARRARGAILDLGAGSGRLLPVIVRATRRRVVALDGSPALVARAEQRIVGDSTLRTARAGGRVEVMLGDVRDIPLREKFSLILAVGLLPHLDGPTEALRTLVGARRRLTRAGRLVLDLPGPGALPTRDLPLAMDWERQLGGVTVTRRSRLMRQKRADETVVVLSTMTDVAHADGTFARLPAAFRLWYPSYVQLEDLVRRAGLAVSLVYGSHDLDRFSRRSERLILIAERARSTTHRRSAT